METSASPQKDIAIFSEVERVWKYSLLNGQSKDLNYSIILSYHIMPAAESRFYSLVTIIYPLGPFRLNKSKPLVIMELVVQT
jgi:galactose-1-phosphate uridylyltransferase